MLTPAPEVLAVYVHFFLLPPTAGPCRDPKSTLAGLSASLKLFADRPDKFEADEELKQSPMSNALYIFEIQLAKRGLRQADRSSKR